MDARSAVALTVMGLISAYGVLCWLSPYRPCPCRGTNVRMRLGRKAWNATQRTRRAVRKVAGR